MFLFSLGLAQLFFFLSFYIFGLGMYIPYVTFCLILKLKLEKKINIRYFCLILKLE